MSDDNLHIRVSEISPLLKDTEFVDGIRVRNQRKLPQAIHCLPGDVLKCSVMNLSGVI